MKISKVKASAYAFGASFIALTLATNVYAQDSKNSETIVVTATGRAKALQDVPVAVTAVSAATIQSAGITDVRNLQQVTPSYKVQTGQSNGSSAQIQVRGIGTGSDNPGYEGAVAVFVDGVYRNRSGAALTDLPKVERIEILRGPQGTLFGRNTSAGAVSITTAAPKFERNIYGKLELGNYGLMSSSLGYTNGLTEHTAVRLEVGGTARDGLLYDVNTKKDVNNRNRYYVRAQTLTDINDDASLRLIADVSKTDELCCSAVRVKSGALAPAIQAVAAMRGLVGIPTINERAAQIANTPGRDLTERVDDRGISGELNWNTSLGKFTSVTAFRKWDLLRGQDVDFSGIDRAYRDAYKLKFDTFTQEFRLNGKTGNLDWLVGAFYMNEKTKFDDSTKYGVDAARYADAVASGVVVPWSTSNGPANPCTGSTAYAVAPGSTIYGSLGGTNSVLAQALCPGLVAQMMQIPGMTLPTAIANAQAISTAYGNAIRGTAPVAGEGQQKEHSDVTAKSWSFFTHDIYELTANDKITIGLRYNHDEKDVASQLLANTATCAAMQSTTQLAPGVTMKSLTAGLQTSAAGALMSLLCNPILNTQANGNYAASDSENAVNGTFSYAHNFSKDLMVYGTYARGYKSGGFNYDRSAFNINPAATTTFSIEDWRVKPEYTDNYELGWKWTGLPGRTTINGALFYEIVTDYQMNAWTGFNFRSFNVDKMVSKGLEVDVTSRPVTGLTLNGGMLLNDAYYDTDVILPNTTAIVIKKGQQLATAPKVTLTGSLNYRRPIEGTSLAWNFYLDGLYNTKTDVQTLFGDASTKQKAIAIFNTRFGIGGVDGSWSVEGWVKNLADKLYHQYALGIPEQTGEYAVYKTDPRTYGVTLRASF